MFAAVKSCTPFTSSVARRGLSHAGPSLLLRRKFASKVVVLSDLDAVEKVTDSSSAILYYTATWCPPCKVIKPVFHGLSEDHEGIVFGQVRVGWLSTIEER